MTGHVIVIGAGILGAATTHAIAQNGGKATLIDAGTIGAGTTGASFGWINASTKSGQGAVAEHYHRLNAAGVSAWQMLAEHAGPELGFSKTGSLQVVAGEDGPGSAAMDRDAAALSAQGYSAAVIAAEDLRRLEPNLSLPPAARGLICANDAVVDGPKAANWFAKAAVRLGARVMPDTAVRGLILSDAGAVVGVETLQGSLRADRVVMCTGIATGDLLADWTMVDAYRTRFPMRQVPGLILQTPPLPDRLRPTRIIWTSTSAELHFLPSGNGGLRLASDDVDRFALPDQPDQMAVGGQHLINRANSWLPGLRDHLDLRTCTLCVGVRPYPSDGLPIVGPLPGAPGLWVALTHSGITLAPVLGRVLARALTQRLTDEDRAILVRYGFARFPGFLA